MVICDSSAKESPMQKNEPYNKTSVVLRHKSDVYAVKFNSSGIESSSRCPGSASLTFMSPEITLRKG